MNRRVKRKWKPVLKYTLLGVGVSLGIFLLFSIPSALLPNPWFIRMIPSTMFDYITLILSSLLLGAYVGVHYYKKKHGDKCMTASYVGATGSALAVSCPICNQLLVALFGVTTLMTYFEPYRPMLGLISIAVLVGALYYRVRYT